MFDVIGPDGTPYSAQHGAALRPNQLIALSVAPDLLPMGVQAMVLNACQNDLNTPYGPRTLSPRDSNYHPHYDTYCQPRPDSFDFSKHKDFAYHQGTSWPWLIGPEIDLLVRVKRWQGVTEAKIKEEVRFRTEKLLLRLFTHGSIDEVFNGGEPGSAVSQYPGGTSSQAWSVAELLRILYEYRVCEGGISKKTASSPVDYEELKDASPERIGEEFNKLLRELIGEVNRKIRAIGLDSLYEILHGVDPLAVQEAYKNDPWRLVDWLAQAKPDDFRNYQKQFEGIENRLEAVNEEIIKVFALLPEAAQKAALKEESYVDYLLKLKTKTGFSSPVEKSADESLDKSLGKLMDMILPNALKNLFQLMGIMKDMPMIQLNNEYRRNLERLSELTKSMILNPMGWYLDIPAQIIGYTNSLNDELLSTMANITKYIEQGKLIQRIQEELREEIETLYFNYSPDQAFKMLKTAADYAFNPDTLRQFPLGGTPYKVIEEDKAYQLRLYPAKQEKTKILIFYALLNSPEIVDFAPYLGRSLISFLNNQGISVYYLYWKNPDENYNLGYYQQLMNRALTITTKDNEKIDILGYCQGGTITLLGILKGKIDVGKIKSLSLLAAPIDTSDMVKEDWPLANGMNQQVSRFVQSWGEQSPNGLLNGYDFAKYLLLRDYKTFVAMTRLQLKYTIKIFNEHSWLIDFVKNYSTNFEKGLESLDSESNKVARDFLSGATLRRWVWENPDLAVAAWEEYNKAIFVENRLMDPENIAILKERLAGLPITIIVGDSRDEVVRPKSTDGIYKLKQDAQKLVVSAGHTGIVTSLAVFKSDQAWQVWANRLIENASSPVFFSTEKKTVSPSPDGIKAIIFDFDGVIADTIPVCRAALRQIIYKMFKEAGFEPKDILWLEPWINEFFKRNLGTPTRETLPEIAGLIRQRGKTEAKPAMEYVE
ncbi:MAG: amylo-alpha-1,6-glucosidase, partial [Candidatus Omnitrophica bacterium]|nr:amylo-alpha-1,6-glucosidase [Candidatus Omnitrophota bacterium]